MPKVTRKSIAAAAQERPTRKARPVFGDVSNNAKGRQSSTAKARRGTSNTAANPATSRRRSSRLSGASHDIESNETTTNTAVAASSHKNETVAARGKTNVSEPEPVTVATRRTRASKNTTAEEEQALPAAVTLPEAKPAAKASRSTRTGKRKPTEEEAPSHAGQSNEADEAQSEEEALDKKPPARRTRTSRGRAKREEDVSPEEEGKAPARKTRSAKREVQDDGPLREPSQDSKPVAVAARRTISRGGVGLSDTGLSITTTARTATKSKGDGRAGPPAAVSTRTAASKAMAPETKDDATKPTRGRGRGKAAVKPDPSGADASEGPRRSARSASRATTAGAAKKSTATGKQGKNKAASKAGSSKRGRQAEQTKRPPRKSARTGRSKSTARAAGRPKVSNPCPDFLAQDDFRIHRGNLTGGFDSSKFTRKIAPVDLPNKDKVEEAPEYVTDIMQRLFDREVSTRPHPYINEQPTLNTNMRSILVDWLVEVHMKFRLEPSTLYLCVNIIDRYLERDVVERSRLQLVGVTALLVACKIEEIFPPEVRDCVYICDRAYTRQEVLDMEATILRTLEYRVTAPTGYAFLVRFLHITKATQLQKFAAHYYMERMLQEYTGLKHRPSLVAASCVTLAVNNRSIRNYEGLRGPAPGMPKELVEYTGFDASKIMDVADKVSGKVQNTQVTNSRRELIAVKRKYESSRYQCVASDFADPDAQDIRHGHRH